MMPVTKIPEDAADAFAQTARLAESRLNSIAYAIDASKDDLGDAFLGREDVSDIISGVELVASKCAVLLSRLRAWRSARQPRERECPDFRKAARSSKPQR